MGLKMGVSHFLQVVIMVALVSAIGIMMYTGATGLFGAWAKSPQVIVSGAYLIGPSNTVVTVRNTGNAPANMVSLEIRDSGGNLLGSNTTAITIEPGKTVNVDVGVPANLTPGDMLDIIVSLDDGSLVKFTLPVQ